MFGRIWIDDAAFDARTLVAALFSSHGADVRPSDSERSAGGDDVAWLVEETWSGFVHYVHKDFDCADWAAECRRDDDRRRNGLAARMRVPIVTKNIDDAKRFPTKDAADLWLALQPAWLSRGDQYQVREHVWLLPPADHGADVRPSDSEEVRLSATDTPTLKDPT